MTVLKPTLFRALALAMFVTAPVTASALTIDSQLNRGTVTSAISGPDITFSWTSVVPNPGAYLTFTSADPFDVFLTSLPTGNYVVGLFSGFEQTSNPRNGDVFAFNTVKQSDVGTSLGFVVPGQYTLAFTSPGGGPRNESISFSLQPTVVPLPAGVALMLTALGGLAVLRAPQRRAKDV